MIRRASRASHRRTFYLFVAALSIVALGAIVGLVEGRTPRLFLAAVATAILTGSAYAAGRPPRARLGPPPGLPDRRSKHVLRHRVNEFIRSVRRLNRIARGTSEGQVSKGAAEDAIAEIYRSLDELTREIRVLAGRESDRR